MIKASDLKGYEKQMDILVRTMRRQYRGFCTFNGNESIEFSPEQVEKALLALGVNLKAIKGKKWYEFRKSNWDEKIKNAIKTLPTN